MKPVRHASQICLVTINGLFLLTGVGGLIAGFLIHVDPSLVKRTLAEQNIHLSGANPSVGILIIITCLVSITLSLVGCVGALCNVPAILLVYAFLLLVVMATQISGVFFITASNGKSVSYLEQGLRAVIQGYNETDDVQPQVHLSPVRILFSVLSCCGVMESADFNSSQFHWIRDSTLRPPNASAPLPLACCKSIAIATDVSRANFSACLGNVTQDTAYFRGCLPVIEELIRLHGDYLILLGTGSGLLEILMILLSARQCIQGKRKLIYEQISITCPHPAGSFPSTSPDNLPISSTTKTTMPKSTEKTPQEESIGSDFSQSITSGSSEGSELSEDFGPERSTAVDSPQGPLKNLYPGDSDSFEDRDVQTSSAPSVDVQARRSQVGRVLEKPEVSKRSHVSWALEATPVAKKPNLQAVSGMPNISEVSREFQDTQEPQKEKQGTTPSVISAMRGASASESSSSSWESSSS